MRNKKPLGGPMQPRFCETLSKFEEKEGYMMVEFFLIKYPYDITVYCLSQKFTNKNYSINYLIYRDLPDSDHKFTKIEFCFERIRESGSRDIICQHDARKPDYFTSIMQNSLIIRFNEERGQPLAIVTCYLFNDCYGCSLIKIFPCAWEEDHCASKIGPRKSFSECIKVVNIKPNDTDVTLTLEGFD